MSQLFDEFRNALKGQPPSAIWQGHGSAIFLEFGRLRPASTQPTSPGHQQGDYTVMIEWSWRIEDENSILCGTWSDEDLWERTFAPLIGRKVAGVSLFGRLPEIMIELTGEKYISSFMTAEGQPMWTIFDRFSATGRTRSIGVADGRIIAELD